MTGSKRAALLCLKGHSNIIVQKPWALTDPAAQRCQTKGGEHNSSPRLHLRYTRQHSHTLTQNLQTHSQTLAEPHVVYRHSKRNNNRVYEVFLVSVSGCVKVQWTKSWGDGGGGRWNRTDVPKYNLEWTSSAQQDLEQDTSLPTAVEPWRDLMACQIQYMQRNKDSHSVAALCATLLKCCCRTNAWQQASRCEPRRSGLRSTGNGISCPIMLLLPLKLRLNQRLLALWHPLN